MTRTRATIVWLVILGAVWLTVGASRALAAPLPTPDEIAGHYAGRPVHVLRGANGLYGYTLPGSSTIALMDGLYDSLVDPQMWKTGRKRDVRGPGFVEDARYWDSWALHVLLHEAYHLRFPTAPEGAVDCAAYYTFRGALARFYGVPFESAESKTRWFVEGTYPLDCAWFLGMS